MNNDFRNELKYIINDKDFYLINLNLKVLLNKDDNCIDDFYTITSIYFDNYHNETYNQVKNGLSIRWKYRIRFYNYDNSFIKLEKKYKENGLTNKESVSIDINTLNNILNRKIRISNSNSKLLNEFILKMNTEFLKPIICIEYDRIPYIYKIGNVRITLDYNIRYTNNFNDLFNRERRMYYINEKVLEVKYNELIPDFIRYKLELNHLEQTSFSKFKNCIDHLSGRF